MAKFIRDKGGFGLFMIPLFVDWGIKRCNIKGCKNKPSTIVRVTPDEYPAEPKGFSFGLCEGHYQEGKAQEGTVQLELEFDDYDAFVASKEAECAT